MKHRERKLSRKEILGLIKSNKITPEDGWHLIKELKNQNKEKDTSIPAPDLPQKVMLAKTTKGQAAMERENLKGIAVIGMSGQFPGAKDINEFWNNLKNGVDSVLEVPKERWGDTELYFDPDPSVPNKTYCKWCGIVSNADKFDPLFFNLSPREAELMDPQQRLFLKEAWRALENAGYSSEEVSDKMCGVFVGVGQGDYERNLRASGQDLNAQILTGSANSILSARISYFLNLTGPNIAIDTACSSSLVAIHQACQSILNHESEIALAGGVSMLATPDMHIMTSKGGMISKDGKCKAFDDSADGFVPSEGVGVVVLKSLAKTIEDNDHIYGVIRGSKVNQDGKTNGITAPSGNSQTKLEMEVYDTFKINPESISYVECHGTGTKLGDPIEISALTKSFRAYTQKKEYCAVGSVKTNIGHGLASAGVAGLIKVLLCMKQNKLVPSIHFNKKNEHINFEDSPFYVNTALADWKIESNKPRRAALSSFGLSGTNCHMVIEDAPVKRKEKSDISMHYYPIPLSAKTKAALNRKVAELGSWLLKEGAKETIKDISFTLFMGRSHFSVRSIMLVKSIEDLERKINEIIESGKTQDYLINDLDDNPARQEIALKEFGVKLIEELNEDKNLSEDEYKQKLMVLADLYIKGYNLNWKKIFQNKGYNRIVMPGYPFADESYWISKGDRIEILEYRGQDQVKKLHPLIDVNSSTLKKQQYTTWLTGNEFYLTDHIVDGFKVLPGVAYIEMVRAAGEMASERKIQKIKDIFWLKPITLTASPQEVHINLYPEKENIGFEIYTVDKENKNVLHSRGEMSYDKDAGRQSNIETLDIDAIKNRSSNTKNGAECYKLYKAKGVTYGPAFKTIKEIFINGDEALSRLELPIGDKNGPVDRPGQFELHPSLMDGALQTVIGLNGFIEVDNDICYLPFTLNEVEITGQLPERCYAYVTFSDDQRVDSKNKKCNILLTDEEGHALVRIKNYFPRVYQKQSQIAKETSEAETPVVMYYRSEWQKSKHDFKPVSEESVCPILIFDNTDDFLNVFKERFKNRKEKCRICLVKPGKSFQELKDQVYEINPARQTDYKKLVESLKRKDMLPKKVIHLWSKENYSKEEKYLRNQLETGLYSIFHISQAFMVQKSAEKLSLFYIYPGGKNGFQPQYAALSGFAKTIRQENPNFIYRTIKIQNISEGDFNIKPSRTAEILWNELEVQDDDSVEICYEKDTRLVKGLTECDVKAESEEVISLKENGVYLITGGTGGLGLIFAEYLARKVRAKLVISDIYDLSGNKLTEEKIKKIKSLGVEVLYLKSDVSRLKDVEELISKTKSHFKRIDGIIHTAGVIRDSFIIKKKLKEIETVLAPKVFGTVFLDAATIDENLDFFILFSAVGGVIGNLGQCDYAYANSFMDNFAVMRENLRRLNKRSGKTLSINWPLWQEGGMRVDEQTKAWLKKKLGMLPLTTEHGIEAFEQGLKSNVSQIMVIEGLEKEMKKTLSRWSLKGSSEKDEELSKRPVPGEAGPVFADAKKESGLQEKTEQFLKKILSDFTKIAVQNIRVKEPFEKYGIDSVIIVNLNLELEKYFGDLSKTLFFEYQNIAELAQYFVDNHPEVLIEKIGASPASTGVSLSQPKLDKRPLKAEEKESSRSVSSRFESPPIRKVSGDIPWELSSAVSSAASVKENDVPEEIAIIGLSGRYPMAKDIEEFWNNLKNGKDCITEIPFKRWDYRKYYDTDKNVNGKCYSKWGGFIDNVDKFDSLFFNISPKEAEKMDPQERIFLEIVFQTIEDAGYTKLTLENDRVAVFVGVMYGHYQLFGAEETQKGNVIATGTTHASIANRVSYYFDFKGPSIALDTMCSSSLTTIHMACESIRRGESDVAIAGGVNLSIHPNKYILLSQGKFISSDGRCRSFGEGGDGYVPGEGVGAVLLKPLKKAISDRDHIYAVVKASSVNSGGRTHGYTVPNPNAQADLIRDAFEKSKIDPRTISYIEAHGTGTSLGDPIEITGLIKAFEGYNCNKQLCSIGSVKSNIGHLESAAGIAGVTKVLLQMKHKQLVPSIHSSKLNPNINFKDSPFYVQQKLEEWKQPVIRENGKEIKYPRRAGISAFGAGGANVHIILQEYTDETAEIQKQVLEPQLIPLSAKNEERLKEYARKMHQFLEKVVTDGVKVCSKSSNEIEESGGEERINLADIAYTLQTGREMMEERLAMVVLSVDELTERLADYCQEKIDIENVYRGSVRDKKGMSELMVEGREGEEFVKIIIDDKKLTKLAQLWVSGVEIDWKLLYPGTVPHRISLPTYPFEKKRYWFDSFKDSKNKGDKPIGLFPANRNTALSPEEFRKSKDRIAEWESKAKLYRGSEVLLEIIDEKIALVVMHDEKNRNTFSENIICGLMAKFSEIRKNKNIKVVIVTGYENIFCMGGTQDQLIGIAENRSAFTDVPFLYRGLLESEVPVIAAIQGHASGGGLLFGLYADIVIMSEESVYSAVFMKYGFTPGMGATFILQDKLGKNLATEMMYTARSFRGEELRDRGASVVFRKGEDVLHEAITIAKMLSEKNRLSLITLKKELSGRTLEQLPTILDREEQMHGWTFSGKDVKHRIQHYYLDFETHSNQTESEVSDAQKSDIPDKLVLKPKDTLFVQPEEEEKNQEPDMADDQLPLDDYPEEEVDTAHYNKDVIQEKLTDIVSTILHLHECELNFDVSFRDLGIDSISGVEIIRDINRAFNLNLDAVLLYDYSTINTLTQFILKETGKRKQSLKILTDTKSRTSVQKPPNKPPLKIKMRDKNAEELSVQYAVEKKKVYTVDSRPEKIVLKKDKSQSKDIAVIGMSGRYPGANNLNEFWNNLANGVDSITEVPEERWDKDLYFDPNPRVPNKTYSNLGGFLNDTDKFDPLFFNISPLEAEYMDPQQRLFLEEAWHALEDAGYSDKTLSDIKCGVFVGAAQGDYERHFGSDGFDYTAEAFTGLSASVLAARISYILNLKGPSIAIDTACSSSLVAIHLACQSILSNESDMAIAGGVRLLLTPNLHIQTSKVEMLSPTGKCRTFDQDADGTILGEGVGVVILKPLHKAFEDRNYIYGVIKGSGINQDGKTNGITAPSSASQTRLELDVYKSTGINPSEISYVEAHGTGTNLGDPIEIKALKDAFGKYTPKKQFCAIGSLKTNIGHTTMAAGVAGVIKILLAMKHKKIPPSINFKKENERIQFKQTPFYVNTALQDWNIVDNIPRKAAISAFGFSGTNCHMVLEEAPNQKAADVLSYPYYLIPLSAKTEEALKNKIKELAIWLNDDSAKHKIGDIAYTLQKGRSHYSVRSALIVKDIDELKQRIFEIRTKGTTKKYLVNNLKQKSSRSEAQETGFRTPHELGKRIIKELQTRLSPEGSSLCSSEYREKLQALADLYINGYEPDWEGLYGKGNFQCIPMPVYPFARDRYWLQGFRKDIEFSDSRKGKITKLHPLIDSNESTLEEQCFEKVFSGNEFYLRDHLVEKDKVLPGVVYLEMARAAANLSSRGSKVKKIKDIVWEKPIMMTETASSCKIRMSLNPLSQNHDLVGYVVSSNNADEKKAVYGYGKIVYEDHYAEQDQEEDIDAIKKRCPKRTDRADCYRMFKDRGLNLKNSFRSIKELFSNEVEALSRIELPQELKGSFKDYELHPTIMDGALETVIVLVDEMSGKSDILSLPYAIGEVDLLKPLSEKCYAHAVLQSDSTKAKKFNVMILDEDGQVLVRIKDFTLKVMSPRIETAYSARGTGSLENIYYLSKWANSRIDTKAISKEPFGNIIIFDVYENMRNALKERLKDENEKGVGIVLVKPGKEYRELQEQVYEINPEKQGDYLRLINSLANHNLLPGKIIHMWSNESDFKSQRTLNNLFAKGIYSVFFLSKVLMEQKVKEKIRLIYIYPEYQNELQPAYAAISGLARTVHIENSKFFYKTLQIQPSVKLQPRADIILQEFQLDDDTEIEIRYEGEKRIVRKLQEINLEREAKEKLLLKKNGVYLITGGLGSLGLIFAKYLAKELKAMLVLTDLYDLNEDKEVKIQEIESLGSKVLYIRADISKKEDVDKLIVKALSEFKKINGIIHCAGVIRDSSILKKTRDEIDLVVAPKIYGTLNLDRATKEENLDFFVLFSSIAAVVGNAGQSDYAYGNSFMDYFAEMREKMRSKGKRKGETLSINWSLWKDGGMRVDKQTDTLFRKTMGIESLDTETGLYAFSKGLALKETQLMVVKGDRGKIERTLGFKKKKTTDTSGPVLQTSIDLLKVVRKALVQIVSDILKIKEKDIYPDKEMSEYGFSSLTLTDFTNQINEKFNLAITPAIFFEHSTLESLTKHLCDQYTNIIGEHQESLKAAKKIVAQKLVEPDEDTPCVQADKSIPIRSKSRFETWQTGEMPQSVKTDVLDEPIAIIGMGGVMPQSEDLDSFWNNLVSGKDLITEIPEDRWDWKEYYSEFGEGKNKTNSKWGGFMNEIDKFDAPFFNISPREAELMDPQQRIFLETVWETIEDAGYKASDLSNSKTGLFVGVSTMDYNELLRDNGIEISAHTSTGLSHCILANRISYLLNLKGPSEPIDTACSSSLIAIHRGVEAIRRGDCEMAVVGGVNVIISPMLHISFAKAGMLSVDGRCKTFDKLANGYVRGEGSGSVMLKPLSKAQKDGDHIYAVIKGTGLNHGGHANSLTAPNPNAQADLLINAYQKAGIDPSTVSYIEAHGTGTSLGDPIEINGLKKAFVELYKNWDKPLPKEPFCGIGSVKTNIGHLETAAGIAGIIKVLLAMKYCKIPKNVHFNEINPYIELKGSPFYIMSKTQRWKRLKDKNEQEVPRRAGVSSFGFGGVNAHIILEEYEDHTYEQLEQPFEPQLICLSAKNKKRLKEYAGKMHRFLKKAVVSDERLPECDSEETCLQKTQKDLLKMMSEILNVREKDISLFDDMNEYGFDPVSLTEFAIRISKKYELEVSNDIFLKYPDLESFSRFLLKEYKNTFIQYYLKSSDETEKIEGQKRIKLNDIAYTLQTGRQAMQERLAMVVLSIEEMIEKLEDYCQEKTDIENVYTGNVKAKANVPDLMVEGKEGEEFVKIIIDNRKLAKLAQLWVSGVEIDWKLLYQGTVPCRISLPTYPFEKRRYWFDSFMNKAPSKDAGPGESLKGRTISYVEKPGNTVFKWDSSKPYRGNEVSLKIINENIALVVMQDSKNRNMFSDDLICGLMSKFSEIQQKGKIKVIIVTGYENIFCMGGTEEQLIGIAEKRNAFTDIPFLYRGLLDTEIPVISAVQGHASGGGLLFGLYADIVIMAEESVYSAVFTKYGFTPGMGATFILQDKLGKNLATEMMFTAKSYRGEEIKNRGASVIFKKRQDVLPEAITIAKMLAEKPLPTLKILKKELASRTLEQLPVILEHEEQMHDQTFSMPEVRELIQRFYHHPGKDKGSDTPVSEVKTKDAWHKISLKPKGSKSSRSQQDQKSGEVENAFDEKYYENLLYDLEKGIITPEQALNAKR